MNSEVLCMLASRLHFKARAQRALSTSPLEPATCDALRGHMPKRKPREPSWEKVNVDVKCWFKTGIRELRREGWGRAARPSALFAVSTRAGSLLPSAHGGEA